MDFLRTMPPRSLDLDVLLDALVTALPATAESQSRLSWLALACETTTGLSPSWRFAQRSGVSGVVVCRNDALANRLSATRSSDTVLQTTSPLASLLGVEELAPVQVLFIETTSPAAGDLKFKLAEPPALVLAALPKIPWRRRWAIGRLQRRLTRQGYDCLALGQHAALFRHRRKGSASAANDDVTCDAGPRLHIRSFDYWDTLITRWHPDPKVVFDYVGEWAGIANFRSLRVQAERRARRQQPNYTLEHIYDVMVEEGTIPPGLRAAIRELELQAEQEFAQPVRANLDRLRAGDVLISDMYLTADQMRRIARPYTDLDRHPFLVSAGGKSSSLVWQEMRKAGITARHLGDNYMADYVRAARRNHQVSLVRECRFSPLEERFHQAGLVALANLLRLLRLGTPLANQRQGQPATGLDGLLTVQRRLNLPLLYLTALELLQRGQHQEAPSHLLFCSRDCGYMHGIYRAMAVACGSFLADREDPQLPIDSYFLTSRKAKKKASTGYVAYSRALLSEGPDKPAVLVVDVQGSGESSHHFFNDVLGLKVQQLFIHTNHRSRSSYQAEALLHPQFVRRLLPMASDLLEVMNYSTDHSILDMHRLGTLGFIPEFEEENRPERLLEICRSFENFFHKTKQLMQQRPFQYLFVKHDLQAFTSEHIKLLEEVDELEDLSLLRELYLHFHRRH